MLDKSVLKDYYKCVLWDTTQKERRERMNATRLKAAMVLKCINGEKLAGSIGISESAFYRKLNGQTEFTLGEVKRIKTVL